MLRYERSVIARDLRRGVQARISMPTYVETSIYESKSGRPLLEWQDLYKGGALVSRLVFPQTYTTAQLEVQRYLRLEINKQLPE